MSLTEIPRRAGPYACDGIKKTFDFAFKIFAATDAGAVITDTVGVETALIYGVDFTVAMNADQQNNPGGTITTTVAYSNSYMLVVLSEVPYTQPSVLTNLGGFFPKVIERAMDRVVALVQQLVDGLSRAQLVPAGESATGVLPGILARAGKLLGWDAAGNPIAVSATGVLPGSITVSALSPDLIALIVSGGGGGGGGGSAGSSGALSGGGRLTLAAATPVMTADVAGAVTVYYTPFASNSVLLNDGTGKFSPTVFAELSQTLADTTKSPAATVANSNYDLFVWSDGGVMRLSRGPAWTSSTARGAGAGTTQLIKVGSTYVNATAIANGPVAQRGTYVGTIRTNAANQVDWKLGSTAAGGGESWLGVWNMSNRVRTGVAVRDSTFDWLVPPSANFRPFNNSLTNRISFVIGISDDIVEAQAVSSWSNDALPTGNIVGRLSIGLDTTTTADATVLQGRGGVLGVAAKTLNTTLIAAYRSTPGLGFHYLQAVEITEIASTADSKFGGGSYNSAGISGVFTF